MKKFDKLKQAIKKLSVHKAKQEQPELVTFASVNINTYAGSEEEMKAFLDKIAAQGYTVVPPSDYYDYDIGKIIKPSELEETIEKFVLAAVSEQDGQDRLAAVGLYYFHNAIVNKNSWYYTYKEVVTEFLTNDADVMDAYRNWDNMDTEQRKLFITDTVIKLRNLIAETPGPINMNWNVENPKLEAYFSTPRWHNERALDIVDKYGFHCEYDFKIVIEDIVHENVHYAQSIGKTDMHKWTLVRNNRFYSEAGTPHYTKQPLEIEAFMPGKDIAWMVMENLKNKCAENKSNTVDDKEFESHLRRLNLLDR